MPYFRSDLKAALIGLFVSPPAGGATLAERAALSAAAWANVYRTYVADARSCQNVPPTTMALDAAEVALTTALIAAFQGVDPSTLAAATATATAFTAFWLTPPVAFGVSGAVTAVGGTAALQAALTGLWTITPPPSKTPTEAAEDISLALHAFTQTVAVAAPPACSGLIF